MASDYLHAVTTAPVHLVRRAGDDASYDPELWEPLDPNDSTYNTSYDADQEDTDSDGSAWSGLCTSHASNCELV